MAMALLQQVCSVTVARTVRSRALSAPSRTVSVPSPSRVSQLDSRVLLGKSEEELQQLALDFGQVFLGFGWLTMNAEELKQKFFVLFLRLRILSSSFLA